MRRDVDVDHDDGGGGPPLDVGVESAGGALRGLRPAADHPPEGLPDGQVRHQLPVPVRGERQGRPLAIPAGRLRRPPDPGLLPLLRGAAGAQGEVRVGADPDAAQVRRHRDVRLQVQRDEGQRDDGRQRDPGASVCGGPGAFDDQVGGRFFDVFARGNGGVAVSAHASGGQGQVGA